MPSISYDEIYEKALARIDDFKLAQFSQDDFYDAMCKWLHNAASSTLLRKKFNSFSLDDEIQTLDCQLADSVDDDYDKEFVTSILAKGLIINYLPTKIETTKNFELIVGTDKEKKILDNYKQNMERLEILERDFSRELSRHGYYFGNYGGSNG